jgi:hypothetical protein
LIPRREIVALLIPAPVLIVTFAVLLGGAALALATGEQIAAIVLKWVAVAAFILLVVDLLLLVMALGVNAVGRGGDDQPGPS